jgi:hypothetical protein
MTEDAPPERFTRAFAAHDAYERDGDAFVLTTVAFDARVTAAETDDWALAYTVTVRAPMLSAAVTEDSEPVGPAVEQGWFETYERRLEDAPKATRVDLELDGYAVTEAGEEAVARFEFTHGNADLAPNVAKALCEYAEGTYVEGVVPGYEYGGVVADLVGRARDTGGDGERGPMPL